MLEDFQENISMQVGEIAELNTLWKEVLHLAQFMQCSKDSVIPHHGADRFYYLAKGEVVIVYPTLNGQERFALFVKPGCIFNEARSVSVFKPLCQFRCTSDSVLYAFPKDILQDEVFITQYPHLIANIISSMGTKMLVHYAYLAEMGIGSSNMLLARFILSLMQNNDNKLNFSPNMTQQDVANLLGIHRTTVARGIRSLREYGAISHFTAKKIIILDVGLLYELANS